LFALDFYTGLDLFRMVSGSGLVFFHPVTARWGGPPWSFGWVLDLQEIGFKNGLSTELDKRRS
jgi:hypothetical protein